PVSTLFPYTTLFRSQVVRRPGGGARRGRAVRPGGAGGAGGPVARVARAFRDRGGDCHPRVAERTQLPPSTIPYHPLPSVCRRRGDRKSTRLNSSHYL